MAHAEINPEMRRCIDECGSCHDICSESISHCLALGSKHSDPEHIRALIDCADLCAASADFMLRGSELHADVCGVCADACDRCAESCDELSDDDLMRRCAEECRRCAESCREMAKTPARH